MSTTRTKAARTLERTSLCGGQTKVRSDDGSGVVEAIVAVTGIRDEVDDIIVPGAYEKTLQRRWPKGVSSHDWEQPVAKALDIKELMPGDPGLPKTTARGEPWPKDAGAVLVKMQFNLATQRGRDAYEDVKFFESEQEWSIGYQVPRNGARHVKGLRYIDTLEWYEFSQVLFGAMPLAGTQSVKGLVVGATPTKALVQDGAYGKGLDGSYEHRRGLVETAVEQALLGGYDSETDDHQWVSVHSTFDDRVVVCHWKGRGETQDYEITYTIIGDEVTLGEPKPVKIEQTLVDDDEPAEPGGDAVDGDDTETKDQPYAHSDEDDDDEDEGTPDEDLSEGKAYLSPSEIAASKAFRDVLV